MAGLNWAKAKLDEGEWPMKLSLAALTGLVCILACAQTKLAFEVASIRPSDPGAQGGIIRPLAGGQTYIANNVPVRLIIKLMYKVTDNQISGGPDWMNTDRYDIRARAERPCNSDELHEMFKTLLADRFGLRFHTETREMPLLALVVDKAGHKMKVSEREHAFEIPVKPAGRGRISGERVPMGYFAWFLAQQLNRPVADKTGLDGFYDFQFEWAPEPLAGIVVPPGPERALPDGPDLFTALRQQLGLRLENQRGPVPVMIIDHLEKPSSN